MLRTVRCFALILLGAALLARNAEGADAADDFRLEALVHVPLSRTPRTRVTIASDGATRIVQEGEARDRGEAVEFRLTPGELAEAREAVTASRFFAVWGPARPTTDRAMWTITVRLGGMELARRGIRSQPEFEPLERHLFRFVLQTEITAGLRRGDASYARSVLEYRFADGVVHAAALVPEIVECAARIEDPARCASTARLLLALPDARDAMRGAQDLLARLTGERRGAVLAAWVDAMRAPQRADHREAFVPIARAESEATWPRWPEMAPKERAGLEAVLRSLFQDAPPTAFEIAERMARTLSRPGGPVVPPGLLDTGEAAVPVVVRLLDATEPGARECGSEMAQRQVGVLRRHSRFSSEALSPSAMADLERRFGAEVVPALERRLEDAAESFAVRDVCSRVLDAWDGRGRAALERLQAEQAEARRRLDAERARRTPPPPPKGTLSIAGRLLADDVPLPGFVVLAVSAADRARATATTSEDGSFRIDGLVEGTYDLYEAASGLMRSSRASGPRAAEGVVAGTQDLVVRLPGSLLRGRLLDLSGSPAVGRRIFGSMRDAPSVQGPANGSALATTDATGRFWLVRLLPGVYDLEVPGHVALRGAAGLEAGPAERTVEMVEGASIAGRLVDETGAPMAGIQVSVGPPDASWNTLLTEATKPDGTFRLAHLDPSRRYRVWAGVSGHGIGPPVANDVPAGTEDLHFRFDGRPRLRFRVDAGSRDTSGEFRIERVEGGDRLERLVSRNPVNWLAAPPGTWKVYARVRDLDARGLPVFPWVEIGTVTTGEPEKTLTVPR